MDLRYYCRNVGNCRRCRPEDVQPDAVWMGLGTAGAVTINMIFFGESRRLCRIVSVGLIIIGVVGLKMVS